MGKPGSIEPGFFVFRGRNAGRETEVSALGLARYDRYTSPDRASWPTAPLVPDLTACPIALLSPASTHPLPSPDPTISVVVNTCERRDELRTLLAALNRQSYDRFEVVAVVGPAEDGTREMLAEEFAGRVKAVDCAEFNLSVSRNLGLAHADGEVVAFIDDDSVPATSWIEQLACAYRDDGVAGAGGRTYLVRPDEDRIQFLRGMFSVVGEQQDVRWGNTALPPSRTPTALWFPRFHGTNMSYRRAALLAVGGFDERFEYLYDDGDIGIRLGLAGFRLRHLDEAIVYHLGANSGNRGRHRYDLNWYSWSRSQIYFALHNGARTVGRRRSLRAALRHSSRLRDQVADLERRGELPAALAAKARRMLRRALYDGLRQGLFEKRRIPGTIPSLGGGFRRFPRSLWRRAPAVPPTTLPADRRIRPLTEAPLSICLLSVDYPPRSTHGVARSTETLARGLAELGHEVHVVTAGAGHRVYAQDGAWVHETGPVAIRRYREFAAAGYSDLAAWMNHSHEALATVRSLIRNHAIQILDSPLWNLDGYVAAVAGDLPVAVRLVTAMRQIGEIHGDVSDERRLLGELEVDFLRRADLLVSNSAATERALSEVYGIDPGSVRHGLVHYGMVPAPEAALRSAPPPSRGGPSTVLFVGRLEGRKGILELFDAIPKTIAQGADLRYVIAGADNSRHDGFLARAGCDYPTWFRSRHPQLADRVEFRGHVSDAELERLYAGCDLFVAPSRYESFGLILLEAMNWAKPVVACRAGGPLDIVVDGETGRLVPGEDSESLAAAIVELAAAPALRLAMGRAGRERLLARFTHLAMAEGFARLYRQTLGARAQEGNP